jgi:hypothetical protein
VGKCASLQVHCTLGDCIDSGMHWKNALGSPWCCRLGTFVWMAMGLCLSFWSGANCLCRASIYSLTNDPDLEAAQLKLVPILQYIRQVGRQTPSIQEGTIGATNVFYQTSRASLVDPAMEARNTVSGLYIRCKIQVRDDGVNCIETPDTYLGNGW